MNLKKVPEDAVVELLCNEEDDVGFTYICFFPYKASFFEQATLKVIFVKRNHLERLSPSGWFHQPKQI